VRTQWRTSAINRVSICPKIVILMPLSSHLISLTPGLSLKMLNFCLGLISFIANLSAIRLLTRRLLDNTCGVSLIVAVSICY